ncbi:helix-turn-helix domain-containing protein [Mesorhizobium sp. B2-4-18]|uniref:helix-turn-helix domain-containing protein n=1 Tax=Mesorhizobium sp. B2-4-18 TaxID=2589931 RepID=UPI0015E36093|nr:helix-turn-helix domain-containing protein [Mesorhizobium sp. B2-4-18]
MAKGGPVFSPDPARAMADQHLTAQDIRVLMAIAAHDRFSKNGIGCTASHTRLANLVGCHLKSLSRSIRTLAERGYIGGRANPLNPQARCYFVIYNEWDEAILKAVKGNQVVTPTGNEAVTSDDPTGNKLATPWVTNSFRMGNRVEKSAQSNQEDASYNILSEALRDPVETVEIYPVETASSTQAPPKRRGNERANSASVGAILAMLERSMKAGFDRPTAQRWFDYLDAIVVVQDDRDDPNFGRAQRLYEELGAQLEAPVTGSAA